MTPTPNEKMEWWSAGMSIDGVIARMQVKNGQYLFVLSKDDERREFDITPLVAESAKRERERLLDRVEKIVSTEGIMEKVTLMEGARRQSLRKAILIQIDSLKQPLEKRQGEKE